MSKTKESRPAAEAAPPELSEALAAADKSGAPDPRLNAYRPDLADARLRGQVEARRFVAGEAARIIVPVANLYQHPPRRRPARTAAGRNEGGPARPGAAAQLLYGANIRVFSRAGSYAWLQAEADSYVGYVRISALTADPAALAQQPTHYVAAPRSFLYSEADLRSAPVAALSLGSRVCIAGAETRRGTAYALLASGEALIAGHLKPLGDYAADYVAVAETLLETPYLWGGASAFGIDCSGLVQLALAAAGQRAPRDSDMQAETIGAPLPIAAAETKAKRAAEAAAAIPAGLRRSDLVFWRGHVAIMRNATEIIHANGHTMRVSIESLAAAIGRIIAAGGSAPIAFRRLI